MVFNSNLQYGMKNIDWRRIPHMKTQQIAVRITDSQRERWEERAAESKRTLADWIRIVVDEHCDELDRKESEKKTEK